MTDRILKAIDNPWVDILGHPTGRRLLKRDPYAVNMEQIVSAAVQHGVTLEINSQVERLDLSDAHARLARERGATLVISTDGHSVAALGNLRWGVHMARRAWVGPEHVLNARPLDEMRRLLRRNRKGMSVADEKGFVPFNSLKRGAPDTKAALAEIRRIYFKTTEEDDRARHRPCDRAAQEPPL
jgi:hypothetical protein